MPRSVIFILSITVLLVTACKKDQVNPANNPNYPNSPNGPNGPSNPTSTAFLRLLPGQWQWIEQTRSPDVFGTPDTTISAASLGITAILYMNSDFTWSLVSDGYTLRNGTYRADTLLTPAWPIAALDFVWLGKDSPVNHWLSTDDDTLWTSNMRIDSTWNLDLYVRRIGIGTIIN